MKQTFTVLYIAQNDTEAFAYAQSIRRESGSALDLIRATTLMEGLDALAQEHHRIDAILLDVSLRDKHFPDPVRTLRNEEKYIPVVVLTPSQERLEVSRALISGANDYLVKGEDDAELVSHLLFQSRQYRAQGYRSRPSSTSSPRH